MDKIDNIILHEPRICIIHGERNNVLLILYIYMNRTWGTSCNMESLASSNPSDLVSIWIASLSATSDMCNCTQKNVRQNINTTVRKQTPIPSFRQMAMTFCRSVRTTSVKTGFKKHLHFIKINHIKMYDGFIVIRNTA